MKTMPRISVYVTTRLPSRVAAAAIRSRIHSVKITTGSAAAGAALLFEEHEVDEDDASVQK